MDNDGDLDVDDIPCFVSKLLGAGCILPAWPCGLGSGRIADCNDNGVPDANDIANGTSEDCNDNFIPDECDIDPSDPDGDGEVSNDLNENGIPDECEPDCNGNGVPDDKDIADATSEDVNGNGIPDECEAPPDVVVEGCRYLAVTPRPLESVTCAVKVTSTEYPCLDKYVNSQGLLDDVRVLLPPAAWSNIHVHGPDILPETTYQIQADYDYGTGLLSPPANVTTRMWGDVVPAYGVVDFNDIPAVVDCFRVLPTAPPVQWCDIAPEMPDGVVDFTDISYVVEAFLVLPYPFAGPDPCP
jgi:hypothetical protein